MNFVLMMLVSFFLLFAAIVLLVTGFIVKRKRKILLIIAAVTLLFAAALFAASLYEGHRFARDYNDMPYIADPELDPDVFRPTYDVVLTREPLYNEGISLLPLDIALTVDGFSSFYQTLTVTVLNESGTTYTFTPAFTLQQQIDDEWVTLHEEPLLAENAESELKDLESVTFTLSIVDCGELDEGTYRILLSDMETEFQLHREWTE